MEKEPKDDILHIRMCKLAMKNLEERRAAHSVKKGYYVNTSDYVRYVLRNAWMIDL